jgi:flagellar biosynthesis/type III secretory pathway protein FliH
VRQGHCELLNEFLPEPGLLTQQNPRLDQNFALFLTAFDKIPTNQPPKKNTTKGTHCSQQVQKEAHHEANGTAARRKRAYQNGVNEGIAKGRAEALERSISEDLKRKKNWRTLPPKVRPRHCQSVLAISKYN